MAATPLVDRALVRAHIVAGLTFYTIMLFAGLLYGLQPQQM